MSHNTFGGKRIFQFKYDNKKQEIKPLGQDYHQGLGDYITSITPTAFKGKFLDMRIQSWTRGANIWNDNLNIIDNNTAIDSSNRIADFTNNGTVQFVPKIDGQPSSEDIVYNILYNPISFNIINDNIKTWYIRIMNTYSKYKLNVDWHYLESFSGC